MKLLLILAGLATFGLPALAATSDAPRPNIILILIDDMGYGDTEPFGSTINKTPNIDRMAQEGMKLTSFYAAPICSPSRAQIMTGCLAPRVSFPNVLFPRDREGISSSEHTVAELLKAQGYETMAIGKWHLGDQIEFLPTHHGFDHYFGFPYSNDMPSPSAVMGQRVMPLMEDDKVSKLVTNAGQDYITEAYTDRAVQFIQKQHSGPFFLYLAHMAVHAPIHPGKAFQGKSGVGRYNDWVDEVDANVGRVLDAVQQAHIDNNTLIVFTSDNGPWTFLKKDGGSAGVLRGEKGTTWEGGMREPFIARWPGHIKPGTSTDEIAQNIDFLPTFVSLAGGTVPTDKKIDGLDISPLLLGETTQSPHQTIFYYFLWQLQAVRSGPWKLAFRPQPDYYTKVMPPDANSNTPRLYNLETDIGEQHDVAAGHPDIVKQLQAYAARMGADLGQDKPGPGVRPPGIVDHPLLLVQPPKPMVFDFE